MTIHQVKLHANDLEFSASSSWPQEKLGKETPAQLFVLLHGFPDNKKSWDEFSTYLLKQFPKALIVAPAMRGYEPSTVVDEKYYRQENMASDVIQFIETLSRGAPAHLIGHDWGAVCAYKAVHMRPDVFTSVVTMAIPHNMVNKPLSTMALHPKQLWYSSYMLTMQFPYVYRPRMAQAVPYIPYIDELWKFWSPTWDYPRETLLDVCQTLQQPGVSDAATAYYRRMLQKVPKLGEFAIDFSKTPFLIIGGTDDGCVSVDLFKSDAVNHPTEYKILEGVGHFMQRENPKLLADTVIEFYKSGRAGKL